MRKKLHYNRSSINSLLSKGYIKEIRTQVNRYQIDNDKSKKK
jgi:competence protein ComGC